MRVLHLICTRNLFHGEPLVATFVAGLIRHGHEAAICCVVPDPRCREPLVDQAAALGVEAGLLSYPWPRSRTRDADLRAGVLRAGIDVVHTHDYKSTVIAARAFRPGEVLRVSSCLGLEVDSVRSSIRSRWNDRALAAFDHVFIAESELAGIRGRRLARRLRGRLEVVRGGFDTYEEATELEERARGVYERLIATDPSRVDASVSVIIEGAASIL